MRKPLLHPKYTLIAVSGYLLHSFLFFLTEYIPQRWDVYIPLDDAFPFIDWFVIPYVLWYLFFAGTAFFFLHIATRSSAYAKECVQFFIYIFGGCAIALTCFVLVPNGIHFRPTEFDTSRPLTWLATLLFRADRPRNVFPSLHCLVQLTCTVALLKTRFIPRRHKRWLCPLLIVFGVLVFLSTAFLRQHSVLDWAGAIVAAAALYPVAYVVPWPFLPKAEADKSEK